MGGDFALQYGRFVVTDGGVIEVLLNVGAAEMLHGHE